MKRNTRGLPDVDLNGRVRRVTPTAPRPTVKVRLKGSVAGKGIDLDMPDPGDYLEYGGWRWSYAGKKDEGRRLYTKVPTSRAVWRFVMNLIGHTGRDPRLAERPRPFVHTDKTRPMKHGRGAAKRAAQHA